MVDHFLPTPPMSTFTLGFVISQLVELPRSTVLESGANGPCIRVWSRPDLGADLTAAVRNIFKC